MIIQLPSMLGCVSLCELFVVLLYPSMNLR